jgi:dipeptidyl aminopeptidase/acylaminoacyl peptidase
MRSLSAVAATLLTLITVLCLQRVSPPSAESIPVPPDPLPSAFGAIYPRLSPDGQSIALTYQGAIWRLPSSGGTMTRLTSKPGFDIEPVWSPDGKRIAFARSPQWAGGLVVLIDAESGKEIPLPGRVIVRGSTVFYKMEFHPDGKRLLSVFQVDGKDTGLSWYNIETGEATPLLTRLQWMRYALSRKGDRIAYTQTRDKAGEQGGNNGPFVTLFSKPASGGEATELGVFPARIHDLCWQADDQALLVATDLGGAFYDLWQVPLKDGRIDMKTARQLTFGQADEHRPSVSADGRSLLFTDNSSGSTTLQLRNLIDGNDKTVRATNFDFRAPTGTLRLSTVDGETGKAITARVSLERDGGKYHAPPEPLLRVLKDYAHFYCKEKSEFTLPAGRYQIRAFHGPEFKTTYQTIDVTSGEVTNTAVKLNRWTSPAKDGWYSGENHIHANYGYGEWYNSPETMLNQSAGEALSISNFMVANSDTDGIFDRRYFRGGPDPISTDETILYWNQEFRSTIWGHMTLVNLSQLVEPIMTGFRDTTNPWDVPTNSDIAVRTHLQNGLVNYTHVAQRPDDPYLNAYTGKSIPIDVALGNIDSLDLNASYAGTVPLWYRLLNCGFKLTASAGTDCFLNRVRSRLPGGDRVYVKLDGPLNYSSWIENLRAGRSFVTNGPMLSLTTNEKEIGSTIRLSGPGEVAVSATAAAQFPLGKFELIQNGKVVATGKLDEKKLSGRIGEPIKFEQSGWLAVRATGPTHPDLPTGGQYAHTSPIYVEVAGKPADSRADALYFLKWIDRLALAVRLRDRIPSPELRAHVESQLDSARDVYRKLTE